MKRTQTVDDAAYTAAAANIPVVITRRAEARDQKAVWRLLQDFAVSYTPDLECFHKQYAVLLTASHVRLFVAEWQGGEREGMVVGYALAFHLPTLYANGEVCEIQELMVASEYRGRGIGRLLLQAIIVDAHKCRAREITVPTRRAGDFYRKFGFVETASYFKLKL